MTLKEMIKKHFCVTVKLFFSYFCSCPLALNTDRQMFIFTSLLISEMMSDGDKQSVKHNTH